MLLQNLKCMSRSLVTCDSNDEEEVDSGVHDEPSTSVSQFHRFSLQGWSAFSAIVALASSLMS